MQCHGCTVVLCWVRCHGTPFVVVCGTYCQPVLQYPYGIFGSSWGLKSWYVTINAGALYTSGVKVKEGDAILCNMTRTGEDSWSISGQEDVGFVSGAVITSIEKHKTGCDLLTDGAPCNSSCPHLWVGVQVWFVFLVSIASLMVLVSRWKMSFYWMSQSYLCGWLVSF